jgi:hypothetical protein
MAVTYAGLNTCSYLNVEMLSFLFIIYSWRREIKAKWRYSSTILDLGTRCHSHLHALAVLPPIPIG